MYKAPYAWTRDCTERFIKKMHTVSVGTVGVDRRGRHLFAHGEKKNEERRRMEGAYCSRAWLCWWMKTGPHIEQPSKHLASNTADTSTPLVLCGRSRQPQFISEVDAAQPSRLPAQQQQYG